MTHRDVLYCVSSRCCFAHRRQISEWSTYAATIISGLMAPGCSPFSGRSTMRPLSVQTDADHSYRSGLVGSLPRKRLDCGKSRALVLGPGGDFAFWLILIYCSLAHPPPTKVSLSRYRVPTHCGNASWWIERDNLAHRLNPPASLRVLISISSMRT